MKSSEYPEETQNLVSSEYTDGIPRKYQSVGIFRGNSEEIYFPRKKPMNSEEILEPLESRLRILHNSEEIPTD